MSESGQVLDHALKAVNLKQPAYLIEMLHQRAAAKPFGTASQELFLILQKEWENDTNYRKHKSK